MPDVDSLGVMHTVRDEWRKFVAPVPARKQDELYDTIGEIFASARRYRGLREALASIYLNGRPVMRDGYGESLVRLHALWNSETSLPEELAPKLPTDFEGWTDYLATWAETCQRNRSLREAGRARETTLAADADRLRTTLVWVLQQLGAFERTERPTPPTPAGTRGEGGRGGPG